MIIADNILKKKIQNVYFIWGSGKTNAANALAEKYGCYVYHTDYERGRHFANADVKYQPAMCREVPDYWALEPEDAQQWERAIVSEFTPMVVADLMELSALHEGVICEGDIDIDAIMPVISHAVTISNHGNAYDFFERPEQRQMLEEIQNRQDISQQEKEKLIENAYRIVGGRPVEKAEDIVHELPYETKQYGVKQIIRYESTTVAQTAAEIAQYFGWK